MHRKARGKCCVITYEPKTSFAFSLNIRTATTSINEHKYSNYARAGNYPYKGLGLGNREINAV